MYSRGDQLFLGYWYINAVSWGEGYDYQISTTVSPFTLNGKLTSTTETIIRRSCETDETV